MNRDKGYIPPILWFMGGSIIGMVLMFFIMKAIGRTDQAAGLLCIPWCVNGILVIRATYFLGRKRR